MTATKAYRDWLAAGQPWTLAQPIHDLKATLTRYGYVVGTIGDGGHLRSNPPEDHTPFSATGSPIAAPRWVVFAADIMPPPAGKGLPTLAQLGAQILADRLRGEPGIGWLKYMNWTDATGAIRHEKWPYGGGHTRLASHDAGHIHLSAYSNTAHATAAAGYDPVARCRAANPPLGGGAVAVVPRWPGRVLTVTRPMMSGGDVRRWQTRMRERGWNLDPHDRDPKSHGVDGYYGPDSADVAAAFQREKHLPVTGRVDEATWAAAWTAPVTR